MKKTCQVYHIILHNQPADVHLTGLCIGFPLSHYHIS
jgi:hypothetical protein